MISVSFASLLIIVFTILSAMIIILVVIVLALFRRPLCWWTRGLRHAWGAMPMVAVRFALTILGRRG